MKRRDFLRTGAAAASLVGSFAVSPALAATEGDPPELAGQNGAPPTDNRPAEYLQRARRDPFQLKPPANARSYPISPMPLAERIRRGVVPQRGFCSIAPGSLVSESLTCGNGAMRIELTGEPYSEQILFHHESLLMPWKRPMEAPKVAELFPLIREMVMRGRSESVSASSGVLAFAAQRMDQGDIKRDTLPHLTVPAFLMQLDYPKSSSVKDYLRTVDFENSEIRVVWTDEQGDWQRRTFASRPDNVVVQQLAAPPGHAINVRVSLWKSREWSMTSGMDWGYNPGLGAATGELIRKGAEAGDVRKDFSEQRLIYRCILDPSVDNSGYAGVTRVVCDGGSTKMEEGTLVVANAASLTLLTRIEYFPDFSENQVEALRQAVEQITPDYSALLEKHREVQSEMLNRVTVDFGGASQNGMSVEELLSDQRSRRDFSPALLEKIFEMGRYWFILTSGEYPSISADINSTINLQTAGAVQGNLREGMEAYFNWMESLAPDCRVNARNIFGFRGASYPLFPDKGMGVSFYYTSSAEIGGWPYWISAGGSCLRPFWDHYLVTGDVEFLRNRVVPAYKELALFYEDFLTVTDENGNYMFLPSISPSNSPRSTAPWGPSLINASMDIEVCREVLTHLIEAAEVLGTDAESVRKWKAMLAKMPPYLLEVDGTLKEWAWPGLEEHYSHRHISHLYGAWPGDEFDPDRTPQLALGAEIANRRRTFDTLATAVAFETLPAYTRCHRALVGARLKDNVIVDVQIRQLLEQGYVSTALRCSREPYGGPVPDAQGAIPAIVMEMLLYSRPGVIEVLPALPETLVKGTIRGMLARTFARIDSLTWNMDARTVELNVTSSRSQDVTLIARCGIEEINAPAAVLAEPLKPGMATCELHLPKGKTVTLKLKIGRRDPLDWAAQPV